MPEEVKVSPTIIIPSTISCAALPSTSILKMDLEELRIQMFLLETELGIPPNKKLSRVELEPIIKNISNEKSEALVNYLRVKIVFNQFDQVENWIKASLECSNFTNKSGFYFVLAEVNYHQGYFKETEFYLGKSKELSVAQPLFLARQALVSDFQEAQKILARDIPLSADDLVKQFRALGNPPFLPLLKASLESAYTDFFQKDYIAAEQTLEVFDHYFQKLLFDKSPDIKLLSSCLSFMIVASKVGLFIENQLVDYSQISSLVAPLSGFYSLGATSNDLAHPSEVIRNPILRLVKEQAANFIDGCNSMGVDLFQVGLSKGDFRFFQLAKDIFKIQTQLTNILYPNIESGRDARIYVLTNLNNSDIALAREELGESLKALAAGVKAINRSDESFPVNLAAASSLRLGAMTHAIYVHLSECLKFVEHSRSHRENFPNYLQERHPQYLGIWKARLDGVRPLTADDVIDLNLKACAYQGESAYSYRQFSHFPKAVQMAMLEQSNWSHRNLMNNILALSLGNPPIQHSFLPLDLKLAS